MRWNCYYALRQVRLHFPEDPVWIDSICIQQDNLSEKGTQVAMMGEIYERSERVLACLGAHDKTSSLLLKALEPLSNDLGLDALIDDQRCEAWMRSLSRQTLTDLDQWVRRLASRPYWTRLWILQELLGGMPNRIWYLCGDSLLLGVHLQNVLECFDILLNDTIPLAEEGPPYWDTLNALKDNAILDVRRVTRDPGRLGHCLDSLVIFDCYDPVSYTHLTLPTKRIV